MQRLADFLTLGRWRVYYLAIACVGLIGIGERLVRPWEGNYDFQGEPLSSDFSTFYSAAHLASHGGASDIYNPEKLAETHGSLVGQAPGSVNTASFFLNPPTFLLALTPFSALPYGSAALAWLLFSLFLLGLCAWLVAHELKPGLSTPKLLVLACLFVPAQVSLSLGQNTALTLAVSCAAFFALRKRRDFVSGLLVGVLIIKPQLGLGFALVLFGGRRYRAIAGAAFSASLLCGASYLAFPEAWPGFFGSVASSTDYVRGLSGAFPVHLSTSVPAALDLVLLPLGRTLPPILGAAFLIAVAVVVMRRFLRLSWEPGSRCWDLSVAAALALAWISSPHLLLYDVTLFLLPAAIAGVHLSKPARPFGGQAFSAWTFVALMASAFWIQLVLGRLQTWQLANGLPRVLPQLVTVALVVWSWKLWRLASGPEGSGPAA
ncbi:MAG: glycosyltransferase family 87 protein [Polyangiales bacterium]